MDQAPPDEPQATPPDSSPEPQAESQEESLILDVPRRRDMMEYLAVLGAADIPTRVVPRDRGYMIQVPTADAERAQKEIAAYDEESRHWPPAWATPGTDMEEISLISVVVAVAMVVWFGLTGPYHHEVIWFAAGAADAKLVMQGEWWRLFTALTLHSDVGHVTSNAFCCALIGTMVCRRIGDGGAWLLIVASGAIGNLITDFLFQEGHVAVGASTAIFGAIGILAGMRVMEYLLHRGPIRFRGIGVPLVVVLAVFSLMGISPEADIMAHLMGAVAGFWVGLAGPWLARVRQRKVWQLVLLGLACAPVLIAWAVALHNAA